MTRQKLIRELAVKIFDTVKTDLLDRCGIDEAWGGCDENVLKEIDQVNINNIMDLLDKELP